MAALFFKILQFLKIAEKNNYFIDVFYLVILNFFGLT